MHLDRYLCGVNIKCAMHMQVNGVRSSGSDTEVQLCAVGGWHGQLCVMYVRTYVLYGTSPFERVLLLVGSQILCTFDR